eukprot:s28_g20.t2
MELGTATACQSAPRKIVRFGLHRSSKLQEHPALPSGFRFCIWSDLVRSWVALALQLPGRWHRQARAICGMETPKKESEAHGGQGDSESSTCYNSSPGAATQADETFGVDSTGPQRSDEAVLQEAVEISGPKDSATKVILNLRSIAEKNGGQIGLPKLVMREVQSICEDGEAVPKSWDPFREAERLRAELANSRSELQRVQKAAVEESDLRLQQAMLQSKVQEVEQREDAGYLHCSCGRMFARFAGLCHTLAWHFGHGGSQPSGDVIWSPRPHLYESGSQKSLYPSGGPVAILSGASCQLHGSIVEGGFTTLLVEYYSSGCPHCWYFAPVFQQVAQAYKGSDTIRVAACNCVENEDACDAMQIFGYPTLRAYKVGAGTLDLLYDVPHFTENHQKSAQELVQWLSERSALWTPPHPQSLKLGAVFRVGHAVAVDGPPGKTGWAMDYHLDDERFVEARLGLLVLLKGLLPDPHPAAVSITSFVSRVFPRHTADFRSLAVQIQDRGPVQPWEMRQMLKKACAGARQVWQLLHVVAASVAAVAVTGQQLAQHGSWTATVPEAMSFFRLAISEFFTCEGCRQHFLEAFDRVLALAVFVRRLATQSGCWKSGRPESLKDAVVDRRWPAYRDCPGCWRAEVVTGGTQPHAQVDTTGPVSIQLLDAAFDLDRVFGYILSQYVGRENLQLEQKVADSIWRFPGSVESTTATTFCACMLLCLSAALMHRRAVELEERAKREHEMSSLQCHIFEVEMKRCQEELQHSRSKIEALEKELKQAQKSKQRKGEGSAKTSAPSSQDTLKRCSPKTRDRSARKLRGVSREDFAIQAFFERRRLPGLAVLLLRAISSKEANLRLMHPEGISVLPWASSSFIQLEMAPHITPHRPA